MDNKAEFMKYVEMRLREKEYTKKRKQNEALNYSINVMCSKNGKGGMR